MHKAKGGNKKSSTINTDWQNKQLTKMPVKLDPISLYMGKSISDLNKTSEYKYEPGRSIKMWVNKPYNCNIYQLSPSGKLLNQQYLCLFFSHINHSDKVFEAANTAKEKGDEERAYVLFMR